MNSKYFGLVKGLFIVCLSAFILLIADIKVFAGDLQNANPTPIILNSESGYGVYIEDFADYLNEDEEAKLAEFMKPVTEYGNVVFLSITDDTKNASGNIGSDTQSYYLSNYGGYVSGVVFSVNPRDIYIYSEGNMYKIVDKAYAYTITDNIYKEAKDDNMYNCSVHCFDMIIDVINGKKIAQPMKYICNILFGLMCSILLCFLYVYRRSALAQTSVNEILASSKKKFESADEDKKLLNTNKVYSPQESSSSGSSFGSGGGFHGGGGFSGGGGGHFGGGGGHHR